MFNKLAHAHSPAVQLLGMQPLTRKESGALAKDGKVDIVSSCDNSGLHIGIYRFPAVELLGYSD